MASWSVSSRLSGLPSTSLECAQNSLDHGCARAPLVRPNRPVKGRTQRLNALPTQESLERFLSDVSESLQNLPPHFGTRAGQQAVDAATQRLQQVGATHMTPSIADSYAQGLRELRQDAVAAVFEPVKEIHNMVDTLQRIGSGSSSGVMHQIMDVSVVVSSGVELQPHWGTSTVVRLLHVLSQRAAGLMGNGMPEDSTVGQAVKAVAAALEDLRRLPNSISPPAVVAELHDAVDAWLLRAERALAAGLPVRIPEVDLSWTAVTHAWQQAQAQGIGGYSLAVVALISAGVLALIAASIPSASVDPMDRVLPGDSLPTRYSGNGVSQYWERRPVQVAQRSLVVAAEAAKFGISLLADIWTGSMEKNAGVRARQLRESIELLGPAYVKVAQALSTRVDLLDMNYLLEIERLQDRVPPFPTEQALSKMSEAFNAPVPEVLSSISPRPVAAASLGQVYKATLKEQYGGMDVAVKVRRPDVLASVSLDLYLMRKLAIYLQSFPQVTTNWASLIDEWAVRFFNEMDYVMEANNAAKFKEQVTQLCDGIVVPDVVPNLSNNYVLTTQWIEGEKLSESNASDVRALCNTLLNCYLIQLLDTGFLHADPHPGNLIRTPEGKICILDYGLMTDVTSNQSIALLEYIAHLSVEDWEGVADDLVNLGFMPPGTDPRQARIVEPLGNILEQLTKGGGAKGFNIDQVSAELEALSRSYPFAIPPYFALILRAFSVIEGIALRVDPDYAIVKECFPYLSRRLLTDESPRARVVLKQLLYGNRRHLDVARLSRIITGFNSFTVQGLNTTEDKKMMDRTTKEALGVVFSTQGTYVQELLVAELAAAVDALSREALSELLQRALGSVPAIAAVRGVEVLGPLRPLLLPLPTPVEIMSRMVPVVAPNDEDEEALSTIRGVVELISQMQTAEDATYGTAGNVRAQELVTAVQQLSPLLPELVPGIAFTGQLFVRTLLRRVFQRLANDMGSPMQADSISALDFMESKNRSNPLGPFGFPPVTSWGPTAARRHSQGLTMGPQSLKKKT